MQTYGATDKGALKVSGYIDPDDTTYIEVFYSARLFSPEIVYLSGQLVQPTIPNGYYYTCTTNGISGAVEPTWTQSTVTSGTVVFTSSPWDLYVKYNETITASTWAASDAVQLSGASFDTELTSVIIQPLPVGVAEFTLTNHIEKSNGESLSRSFKFKVNDQ